MESDKQKEEPPHLSGAYIRSLVKQLSSSRTKDPMNPKDGSVCGDSDTQNMSKFNEKNHPENHQPQQHKKQVRRRLHTTRPYQERLLNMAEARREIVTALKLHRAAMKQANEQQNQQHQLDQQHSQSSVSVHLSPSPGLEQQGKVKSRRNTRIYPSSNTVNNGYLNDLSYNSFSNSQSPYPFSLPTPPLVQSSPIDNLNFALPNQTLGLSLNLQDFNDIETNLYHNNPSSFYSSSSSSSPSLSIVTEELGSGGKLHDGMMPPVVSDDSGSGMHHVMDDDEMAEMRSLGEQHEMEWNDTMNLVTSAWWFKFMKSMEFRGEVKAEVDDEYYQAFDQVMEFPEWLNGNDGCFMEQHFNDCCSQDYLHDPSLPCMDIGEIDGMDGEWLS